MLTLFLLVAIGLVSATPKVDDALLHTLQTKGSANIVLTMSEGNTQQILESFQRQDGVTRAERLNTVVKTLKDAATKNEAEIQNFISFYKSKSTTAHYFWITNKIIVRSADYQLVQKLVMRHDLKEIREEKILHLSGTTPILVQAKPNAQPGIELIRAPDVWALNFKGQGAVVATIDTGVRGTHEALVGNHRVSYGWFDPEQQTPTPNDQNGHGTFSMGIIVGQTNGIGVAPDAQWIACKGCGGASCTELALLRCGEWVTCPTDPKGENPDCSQAPHVVSNSWGGGQGDTWYDDVLLAWLTVDITPIFGMGNSGPHCGTASSPGDSEFAIAVGSLASADHISDFSGHGPPVAGNWTKPDVVAPGNGIYSAYNTGDSAYVTISGTSAAAPHAAGLVGLLKSKKIDLDVNEIKKAMFEGAVPIDLGVDTCGSGNGYPNNVAGWGRIHCLNSINLVQKK